MCLIRRPDPFGGRILNKASSATSQVADTVPVHEKFDNSRYSFNGRSYGVGSSVGLPAVHLRRAQSEAGDVYNMTNLAHFSYEEVGYKTEVSCMVNDTSAWNIWIFYQDTYTVNGTSYGVSGTWRFLQSFFQEPNLFGTWLPPPKVK